MTNVKPNDVQSLIDLFDESTWTEMHLEDGDFELHLSKDSKRRFSGYDGAQPNSAVTAPPLINHQMSEPASAPSSSSATKEVQVPEGLTVLRAPNLGTFYRSPKPGSPPYIEIGQQVEGDTDICLIEVMKLFTPVKAGMAGTIVEVLIADGELVEFDQPLFFIRPSGA